MLRQVHPNALRYIQYQQAIDLLEQCHSFHADWDTLKYEFAPHSSSPHLHRFNEITGKEDYEFAVLRDKIVYLVDTTKETFEGRRDASHTDVIRELSACLEWMTRKARELKAGLEGEGHSYRDGKPMFKVLGASKEPADTDAMDCDASPGIFVLRSADASFQQPSTPVRQSSTFE